MRKLNIQPTSASEKGSKEHRRHDVLSGLEDRCSDPKFESILKSSKDGRSTSQGRRRCSPQLGAEIQTSSSEGPSATSTSTGQDAQALAPMDCPKTLLNNLHLGAMNTTDKQTLLRNLSNSHVRFLNPPDSRMRPTRRTIRSPIAEQQVTCEDVSEVSTNRFRKSKLPWLDGSQGKHDIHLHVPGEYHDSGSASPNTSTSATTPSFQKLMANKVSANPYPLDTMAIQPISPTSEDPISSQAELPISQTSPLPQALPPKPSQQPSISPRRGPDNDQSPRDKGPDEHAVHMNAMPISRVVSKANKLESPSRPDVQAPEVDPRKLSLSVQPIRRIKGGSPVNREYHDTPRAQSEQQRRSISVQPIKVKQEPLPPERPLTRLSPDEDDSVVKRNLQNSIAGLEDLMQEAVQLAKSAANEEHESDVPRIFGDFANSLRKASNAQNPTVETYHKPLTITTSFAAFDSSSSSDTESSEDSNRTTPVATQINTPILRTHMRQPQHVHLPESATTDISPLQNGHPRTIWDEDIPLEPITPRAKSIIRTPSRLRRAGSPVRVDWVDAAKLTVPKEQLEDQQEGEDPEKSTHDSTLQARDTQTTAHLEPPTRNHDIRENTDAVNNASGMRKETGEYVDVGDNNESHDGYGNVPTRGIGNRGNWGRDKYDERDFANPDLLKTQHHVAIPDGLRVSFRRMHRHQPVARNWSADRKRLNALVACLNTAMIGVIVGIYAGEVPAIQYVLADAHHNVILGNVVLYIGMSITTLVLWPLPLLHGRKPYTLVAFAIALPLQFPQAIVVGSPRAPQDTEYIFGLLFSRAMSGLVLGLAQINCLTMLLDLFGASLQSRTPHEEFVVVDDIRRHGGGMGLWLGIWTCCFIGTIPIGFMIGAEIIGRLNVAWGFYLTVVLLACILFMNVVAPETRRAPHRKTFQEVELPNETVSRRIARGEIKMHVAGDGPIWWWEEIAAGVYLSFRMMMQGSFAVMALYVGWIYGEIVLIVVLLGNLLSVDYRWRPKYVGLGVLAVTVGAVLAIPTSKANWLSRARTQRARSDSMTLQPRVTWTSHLVRRVMFMVSLPVAGLAYTLSSKGESIQYMAPIVFAAVIGYFSNLAITECNGIIMEAFDTSDLQPGSNSRHRLQSLQPETRRRRTIYSSYPRVSSGLFLSQGIGFLIAAAATGVGGAITRHVGAQKATAITASILLGFTVLLVAALWRFKTVQVIPNELFGSYFGSEAYSKRQSTASFASDRSWRAVIIGNPSGRFRRMSFLELGSLSRWTEIRRLNRLLSKTTRRGLQPGWQ